MLLNVKARLFSRDQPATYLAADVIFKAAQDCSQTSAVESVQQTVVGNTSLSIVCGGEGTVLRLERVSSDKNAASNSSTKSTEKAATIEPVDSEVTWDVLIRLKLSLFVRAHRAVRSLARGFFFALVAVLSE